MQENCKLLEKESAMLENGYVATANIINLVVQVEQCSDVVRDFAEVDASVSSLP
jgi:hypothetical protein